ncbi:MAG: hypothetical protein GXP63_00245 [DPANN group archaeon]|nr:hypothetical protein [DPANN group archaeon]
MDPRLHAYIQEQRKRGVPDSQIKLSLLRAGYAPSIIDAGLARQEHHHLPMALIIVGFLVVVVAMAVVFFTAFNRSEPSFLLDLNTKPLQVDVEPGGQLSFIKEISSMGSAKRHDMVLTHSILNPRNGDELLSKKETMAIETKGSSTTTIDIPADLSPGYYLMQTLADYEGKQAVASFLFKVYKKGPVPTCFDNEQNQDETGVDCGGSCDPCDHCSDGLLDGDETDVDCGGSCVPCVEGSCFDNVQDQDEEGVDCGGVCRPCLTASCFDGIRNQDETGIDCGGICRACTQGDRSFRDLDPREQLIFARNLATTDPDQAHDLCTTLTDQAQKDECIAQVADEVDDKAMCDQILIPSKKDSCLLSFALEGDYTVCSEITNIYLMNSCLNLEKAAAKKASSADPASGDALAS